MKPEPPTEEELRQQQAMEAQRLDELRQQEARQAFKQRAEQEAEEAKRRKDELAKEAAQRQQTGEIADARIRYGIALADNYRISDPYGSLAQASMQEYGAFLKGQQELKIAIANEPDPEKRRLIELRREIEAHDYMAITSERLGGLSATIAGREDAPQAVLDRARAAAHAGRAGELREERVGLIAEHSRREQEQREAAPGRPQPQAEPASHATPEQPQRDASGQAQEPAAPTQARAGDERKPDEAQRPQRAPDPSQQSAAGQTQARAGDDKKRDEDRQQAPGGKDGAVELTDEQRLKLEKSRATRDYYVQREAQKEKDRGDRGGGGGRSGR